MKEIKNETDWKDILVMTAGCLALIVIIFEFSELADWVISLFN